MSVESVMGSKVMLLVTLLLPVPARAADVVLLDSTPGDFIGGGILQRFSSADGAFSATGSDTDVEIDLPGSGFWSLHFAAAAGTTLGPGSYEDATRWPFQGTGNGLDVSGDGRGCNELSGRFFVFEYTPDGVGGVTRFAADFEQHCEDGPAALFGSVRFHSDVPITRPCGDQDRDGEADVSDECPGTPLGEEVDQAGCSVAQFCERIDVGAAEGRRVCRAADWRNDGVGRRKASRDCQVILAGGAPPRCEPHDPASRPDDVLELSSDPGDFIGGGLTQAFTRADGTFVARQNFSGGVDVFFSNLTTDPIHFWDLSFAAANGLPLVPGTYAGATRFPFEGFGEPGLSVDGDGRGCNTLTGSFDVSSVVFDSHDRVGRFEATFEQHCEGAAPALRGHVRFVRATTFGLTCLDTDGDGEADATDGCPGTPAGAAVDRAGCSRAQFCAAIDPSAGKGSVCSVADWRGDSPRHPPRDCTVVGDRCVAR
jgi:hypothetical protein